MIVCLCTGTDDRTIRSAIAEGRGTVDSIMAECGAGSGCGGCREFIAEMIEREERPEKRLPMLSPYLVGA